MEEKDVGSRNVEKNQHMLPKKQPKDPLHILFERETGGRLKRGQPVYPQVFQKLPGRLAFNLTSLVDDATLQDGHVFLGFTKSGQFIMSYTHCVEADEHTAYPIYVYRLQWWKFVPYRRLQKVAEVRLFGEEEIQQDVFIMVCEWPRDSSRILIHGYCAPNDNEEKHQCYVTVTAVPPVDPCDDCNQLAILNMYNRYQNEAPPRCLNHAFTVHTKYELAPPYPSFCPKVFLKLDGVVIVNTGDSLIAFSVDIEDHHGGFGFGLFSPRVARTFSSISSVGSPSEDQMSVDSHDVYRISESAREHLDLLGRFIASSPNSNLAVYRSPPTPKDTTNVPGVSSENRPASLRGESYSRQTSIGKENLKKDTVFHRNSVGSPVPVSSHQSVGPPETTYSPQPSNIRSMDVYNFEGSTPTGKRDEDTSECYEVVTETSHGRCTSTVRSSLALPPQGARMHVGDESKRSDISLCHSEGLDNTLVHPSSMGSPSELRNSAGGGSTDVAFERPPLLPTRHSSNKDTTHTPTKSFNSLSPLGCTLCTESPGIEHGSKHVPLAFSKSGLCSPGGKMETSSTCSSCFSAPIILQSDSQCFTYSVRRYVQTFAPQDGPIDMEDDLNLAYHSVLPLDVHGAHNCQMRMLTKQCPPPQTPCIVVKQLTLDIEHYLGETVRTKAEWGSRYLSFTNYDVQIVDVCPETNEVIALVFVLIRARPPKDKSKPYIHGRSVPRLYQSGLKLVWNLRTGSYNTLDIEDLEEVNQADFMRRRKQWHPGNKVCEQLYRKYAVPQLFINSVNVLNNEAVFKGQSLKILLDRQNYIAVLL